MKAMILAAGLGTRLRPLTDTTPKPLLPVKGRPLIEYAIELLHTHDLNNIIINTHHLASQITDALGNGSQFGVTLSYSHEETLLGTGGGIKQCEDFFQSETFIVINSDILMQLDLKKALAFHQEHQALATMVVRPHPEPTDAGFKTTTPLWLTEECVTQIGGVREKETPRMFTGLHILEPEMLATIPAGQFSSIIETAYQPALVAGKKIVGYMHTGLWKDVGTMEQYQKA